MTAIPKLTHIDIVRQAEKTVAAHEVVHETIAAHGVRHAADRQAEDDKKRADGYLVNPIAVPRA